VDDNYGILLRDRIDDLYKAGLRSISVGYYGTGEEYDKSYQRKTKYTHLEEGVAYLRDRFGMSVESRSRLGSHEADLQHRGCSPDLGVAERYCIPIGVSLITTPSIFH